MGTMAREMLRVGGDYSCIGNYAIEDERIDPKRIIGDARVTLNWKATSSIFFALSLLTILLA